MDDKMSKSDYRAEAHHLIRQGISVGPIKLDGSKLPAIRWTPFQDRLMTAEEVEQYFFNCGGIFAITGTISRLFCFDFDTKYDYPGEDSYALFIQQVPEELKAKLTINQTRSGGKHFWLRTDYTDKSRKVTRRPLTLSEFTDRVQGIIDAGANPKTAMNIALRVPYENTLETRGNKSYGVIVHPDYKTLQKSNGQMVSPEEVEFLLNIGYSLDCGFTKKEKVFVGASDDYKYARMFNDDTTPEGMVRMIEMSGLYHSIGADNNGNVKMRRTGSNSNYSGYVYATTRLFKIFGTNLFDNGKDLISPLDVYMILNNFTMPQALAKIKQKYAARN